MLELITIGILLSINFNLFNNAVSSEEGSKYEGSLLSLFREGISYIIKTNKLIFALIFSMLVNFVFGAVNVGLPFLQINVLQLSNTVYGVTEAIFSLKMILSGIYLSISKSSPYPLYSSWRMINIIGLLLFIFGLSLSLISGKIYVILIVGIFNLLMGIAITWVNVPVTTWMTTQIPKNYQGRVFNIMNTGAQLLSPLGMLTFSLLFDHFNAYIIFLTAGLMTLTITILYPLVFKISLKEDIISNDDASMQLKQGM